VSEYSCVVGEYAFYGEENEIAGNGLCRRGSDVTLNQNSLDSLKGDELNLKLREVCGILLIGKTLHVSD